jgi:hypothetical protein
VLQRWWRRLLAGQPSIALGMHAVPGSGARTTVLALACPVALRGRVEAALRTAYPNAAFERFPVRLARAPCVLRVKKGGLFVTRIRVADARRATDPPVDRVIGAIAATGRACAVQVALTPVPALFELYSRWLYRGRDRKASDARDRGERRPPRDRSEVDGAELRGGLDVQHRPLFFADVRVVASERAICEAVAAPLRTQGAENRLVELGSAVERSSSDTRASSLRRDGARAASARASPTDLPGRSLRPRLRPSLPGPGATDVRRTRTCLPATRRARLCASISTRPAVSASPSYRAASTVMAGAWSARPKRRDRAAPPRARGGRRFLVAVVHVEGRPGDDP